MQGSDGMHDGGVAGIAVGLFFAGVLLTLIVCYIIYRTGESHQGIIETSNVTQLAEGERFFLSSGDSIAGKYGIAGEQE